MTDIEDRLRQGLEHRANQVQTPRTPINTIRSGARRVQRARTRRTIGLTVGAVAAVAVVATILPQIGHDGPPNPDPANPAPSGSDTPSQRTEQALPVGPAPQVPFVVDTEYRTPDGSVLELGLPRQSAQFGVAQVTPFEGGALIADGYFFEGTNGLFLLSGSQTTELAACSSGTGAASDNQQTIAWATFACPESGQAAPLTVQFATADGSTDSFEVPTDPNTSTVATVVGVVGESVILNRVDDVIVASPDGTTRTIQGGNAAIDVAADRAIVTGGPDGDRVVDVATGRTPWSTNTTLLSFSPSGERVLGRVNSGSMVILEAATGDVVREFDLVNASDAVWEDDSHILYLIESRSSTSIVRINLDGDLEPEQAGEPFPAGQRVLLPNAVQQ